MLLQGPAVNHDVPTSTSGVVELTDVCHHTQPISFFETEHHYVIQVDLELAV
jgi:hypothetical protein